MLTNADVLRIEVAAANANQQVLQSDLQAQVARQGLLNAVGLSLDDETDFVEPAAGEVPPPPALEDALKLSELQRHELAATRHEAEAAAHRRQARSWRLLPDLNLEAAYIHIEGQALAPKNQRSTSAPAQASRRNSPPLDGSPERPAWRPTGPSSATPAVHLPLALARPVDPNPL